jgi:hypothetical protein
MNCPLKELFAHMLVGTQSAQATRKKSKVSYFRNAHLFLSSIG